MEKASKKEEVKERIFSVSESEFLRVASLYRSMPLTFDTHQYILKGLESLMVTPTKD